MPLSHRLRAMFLLFAFCATAWNVQAGSRIADMRASGALGCGVAANDPGFSQRQPDGSYQGLEADLCRAVAAALFDNAQPVRFVPLDTVHEFLADATIDVVFHRLSWSLTREAPGQLEFGPVYYLEAVSGSLEMLAPLLRSDDADFSRVVRWAVYALMDAEARGVTRANVTQAGVQSRWPLGETGLALGLNAAWAYRMVEHVGNYGEIFERHLGKENVLALPRGPNRLWRDGGLLMPPLLK